MCKCRFCGSALIDGITGELKCEVTDEVKSFEEANVQHDCEHYELCQCEEPEYIDFYAEELYDPERDEIKPVSKDQIRLDI